jgi:hypothetical protein
MLSWITLTDTCHGASSPPQSCRVSILVVVDHSHRRAQRVVVVGVGAVSILVVVDHPHRLPAPCPIGRIAIVSILVVVDHPHRRRSACPRRHRRHHGFNPCCRGSPSPTLFLDGPARDEDEFQSLLSWITLTDDQGGVAGPAHRRVSILVVVDHPHRPPSVNGGPSISMMFQSLLSWSRRSRVGYCLNPASPVYHAA